MVVVVMGVSGCGKSTVARALARALGARFVEGDDFHSERSRAKMAAGTALDDRDRAPWLDALAAELSRRDAAGESVVLACSALKRGYRDRLRAGCAGLRLVHLDGDAGSLATRLARRRGHYMPASLLASQLATLERPQEDEQAIVLDAAAPVVALVGDIVDALSTGGADP